MILDVAVTSDARRLRAYGFEFLTRAMVRDMRLRGFKEPRLWTFLSRVNAQRLLLDACAGVLTVDINGNSYRPRINAADWLLLREKVLPPRQWSIGQGKLLQLLRDGLSIDDANELHCTSVFSRYIYVSGEPGSGKSEAIVYAAAEAARRGAHVLIGCPLGVQVSAYRDRLPADDKIVCETIHSAWRISRKVDAATYNPPSRLRAYDLIFIDEAPQIDDRVWTVLWRAILELPQKPLVVIAGDLAQLEPIHGGKLLRNFVVTPGLTKVTMEQHEFARSSDSVLLDFLALIRHQQPSKPFLLSWFGERYLGRDLRKAVRRCLAISGRDSAPMTWLTSLTKGAMEVNYEYLFQLGYGTQQEIEQHPDSYPCDPDSGEYRILVRPGMWLRLCRNLDKDRGFCNGALGKVCELLRTGPAGPIFTMQLTHGAMVLVHPISDDTGKHFLPCIYGYGMSARKAQGSTLAYAVLYFDLWKPACRGHAYVGSSRVPGHDRLYYFGRIRQSDWLPVGGPGAPIEHDQRGILSEDSDPDLDYENSSNSSDSLSMSVSDDDELALFGDADETMSDSSADAFPLAGDGQTIHAALDTHALFE